jgi:hypothetical protein
LSDFLSFVGTLVMLQNRCVFRSTAAGVFLCLLLAGCSGNKSIKYKVSGKLTSGGKALRATTTGGPPAAGSAGTGIQLIFYPLPDGQRPADPIKAGLVGVYAAVNKDGEYQVPEKLAPGKYVIAVHIRPQGPLGADELKERFSFRNSKIVEEINEDRTLDIELDKYK